jgi:cephalosporin hydroxylase
MDIFIYVLAGTMLVLAGVYVFRLKLLLALQPLISNLFHIIYYASGERTWANTKWMGATILKNPFDMWIYQELLFENQPDLLIECGTNKGGSALYFAHMFDLLGNGRIVSIDINKNPGKPVHPRIEYLVMSSTSDECMRELSKRIKPGEKVMAVLDSDHSMKHVRRELELYGPMVTKGQYMVVEDSNVNGHPVTRSFGPGPMEAIHDYLHVNRDFEIDPAREKFMVTFFPDGWLRKVR